MHIKRGAPGWNAQRLYLSVPSRSRTRELDQIRHDGATQYCPDMAPGKRSPGRPEMEK